MKNINVDKDVAVSVTKLANVKDLVQRIGRINLAVRAHDAAKNLR